MNIIGLNKTSLVDYDTYIASTIFTYGCQMRCPFCHNKELVIPSNNLKPIPTEEIILFLESRKNILEGVCITGGEPTLQSDLIPFIARIKALGLLVKIDTNGINFNIINELIHNALIDYIAMDIKNSKEKYCETASIEPKLLSNIEKSVDLIANSSINYEFRTTTIKEFHDLNDFIAISHWLPKEAKYILQKYQYSENQINPTEYTPFSKEEITSIQHCLLKNLNNINLRGY